MTDLIFDKYEIQHRLAIGGMGEVFYGVQTSRGIKGMERPVILKSLLPDLAQQEEFVESFLDEARVAATLNHPNVVAIFEVGQWNGIYFIVMEYIRGRNIAQLMKKSIKQAVPVPPVVTARIIHDAALGLDHAHFAKDNQGKPLNIVHRDISPQNIMVRDDGVTKVVDFGIAKASNKEGRTKTGAIKGKLAYMAPEQVLGQTLTGAADQWALGVCMWEMLAGRRMFTSENDVELIRKVLEEPIAKPSLVRAGLPEEFDEITLRMLARDPAIRYPTLADAAKELSVAIGKFSPATAESPVASYMKLLGLEDLNIAPPNPSRPSNPQNFVISLNKNPNESPEHMGTSVGADSTKLLPEQGATNASQVMTANEIKSSSGAVADAKKRRGAVMSAVLGAVVLAAAGVGYTVLQPGTASAMVTSLEMLPVVKGAKDDKVVPPPPPAKRAKLTLKVTPPDAKVRFDGAPQAGVSPFVIEIDVGRKHFMSFERRGYKDVDQEIEVAPGLEVAEREVKLEELPKIADTRSRGGGGTVAPPQVVESSPGFLTIDTQPWTKVTVDGEYWGSTPIFKRKIASGAHDVRFVNEGENINKVDKVIVKSGETTKFSPKLR